MSAQEDGASSVVAQLGARTAMDQGGCPAEDRLAAFRLGDLAGAEREAIAVHLGSCPRCEAAATRLGLTMAMPRPAFLPAPEATLAEDPPAVERSAGRLPRQIAGYEILDELGRGGMAVVYRAYQARLGRVVALKMMLAARYADPQLRDRFRREAEAIAGLRHPHIVQIFDIGEEPDEHGQQSRFRPIGDPTVLDLESQRQIIQERLDGAKPAAERNRLGQFATPPDLALDIARYALGLRQGRTDAASFLDPAIGSGSFYSALRQTFPHRAIADACGVEIDPPFAEAAMELWGPSGLRIIPGDFTLLSPDRLYDLVLTNPPYVRHHHLDRADKERLKSLVADRFGVDISGLAGLYAYFLLLCDAWMAPGGLAVWLVPSEFMDVNYGASLKAYLTDHVKLIHVHRYCPSDVQFCDALVTSAIVVFEKTEAPPHHRVRFSLGGPITNPASSTLVPLADLRKAKKWTGLSRGSAAAAAESHTLGDFFSIKRGMATGANSFFILEREEAIRLGIPAEFLRPILPSSRHLSDAVIDGEPDGYPRLKKPLAVIDCDLAEEAIQQRHPAFWRYLEQGKAQGIQAGYLASRRVPWYSQEKRGAAPFLCTYMGRPGGSGNPFRFFWNRSQAVAANVYLMLYPKGELKAALDARPDLYSIIFAHLQSVTGEHLIRQGRVYGGGLHKLEPKELANLPAGELARTIQDVPTLRQFHLAI